MNVDEIIEQWEEKHSLLLSEYSKGNANNEVMQMYRDQMKNILDFINQLKRIKETLVDAMNLGMNLRQVQLNGFTDKSGN